MSEEDEPLMNVTPSGERSHNGSGPLHWLGGDAHPATTRMCTATGIALHGRTAGSSSEASPAKTLIAAYLTPVDQRACRIASSCAFALATVRCEEFL